MKIGINCGHSVSGQPGCGAVGFIDESVETRKVGKKLMELFKNGGHSVFDCTNDYASSVSENLKTIVNMANKQPLDLFVSIHFNAGGGKGTEVFTYGGTRHSEALSICNALNSLGFVNRGVKDGSGLYVIHHSEAKAMLIEVCFVDTQSDVDLYINIGTDKIAQAIYKAITGERINKEEDTPMTSEERVKMEKLEKRVEELEKKSTPMIYNYVDNNMPAWARDAVTAAINKGAIIGDDDGLGLTYSDLRAIVREYRMGIYN